MKRNQGRRGFTLLEILVVLIILLTGLTVLSQLMNAALRQSTLADEQTSVQLFCQNLMNRILSGETAVLSGTTIPIDRQPNWLATVHLEQGILPNILAVRIVAQKYEETQEPSPDLPGRFVVSLVPVGGQNVVVTQWVRRDAIKIQTAAVDANGAFASPDSLNATNDFSNPGVAESGYFQPSGSNFSNGTNADSTNGLSTFGNSTNRGSSLGGTTGGTLENPANANGTGNFE